MKIYKPNLDSFLSEHHINQVYYVAVQKEIPSSQSQILDLITDTIYLSAKSGHDVIYLKMEVGSTRRMNADTSWKTIIQKEEALKKFILGKVRDKHLTLLNGLIDEEFLGEVPQLANQQITESAH